MAEPRPDDYFKPSFLKDGEKLEAHQIEPPKSPEGKPNTFLFSSDHKEAFVDGSKTTFSFILKLKSGDSVHEFYSLKQLRKYTKFYFLKVDLSNTNPSSDRVLKKYDGVYKTKATMSKNGHRVQVDFEFPTSVKTLGNKQTTLSFRDADKAESSVRYVEPGLEHEVYTSCREGGRAFLWANTNERPGTQHLGLKSPAKDAYTILGDLKAEVKEIRRCMGVSENRLLQLESRMLSKLNVLEMTVNSLPSLWMNQRAFKSHPELQTQHTSALGSGTVPLHKYSVREEFSEFRNENEIKAVHNPPRKTAYKKADEVRSPKSNYHKAKPSEEERRWLETKLLSAENLSARELFNDWKLRFHLAKTPPEFKFVRTAEQMHVASVKFLSLSSKSKPKTNKKKAKDYAIMKYFEIYLDQ
ncbi:hypothetical protein AAMO2058_000158300 [Amorphochlora amoebiformis]